MDSVLLRKLLQLCHEAGAAISDIYQRADCEISLKSDQSPVTLADRTSHDILVTGLGEIASYPVLSEEAAIPAWSERQTWGEYWLIDPLDGTREFIKRNGDFTVNIALIKAGKPILGVVYAPVTQLFYYGASTGGAFRQVGLNGQPLLIQPAPPPDLSLPWRLLDSRSYRSEAITALAASLTNSRVSQVGSSLKLCLVAEGAADLYPRFGPTSEWDTAAAQAVVEAAGGCVLDARTLRPLTYNIRESLLNPSFVVCAEVSPAWSSTVQALAMRG